MREEVIVELARKHLDEHVTIYFRNEYVKGRWVEVDLHTKIISLIPVGKPHNRITIDYSEITAIEYEDVEE